MPEGKVRNLAETLLKAKNRLKRTLTLEAIGDSSLRAGNSVLTVIENLGDISLNQMMLIESCTHNIKGSHHTMTLNLMYV